MFLVVPQTLGHRSSTRTVASLAIPRRFGQDIWTESWQQDCYLGLETAFGFLGAILGSTQDPPDQRIGRGFDRGSEGGGITQTAQPPPPCFSRSGCFLHGWKRLRGLPHQLLQAYEPSITQSYCLYPLSLLDRAYGRRKAQLLFPGRSALLLESCS